MPNGKPTERGSRVVTASAPRHPALTIQRTSGDSLVLQLRRMLNAGTANVAGVPGQQ